MKRISVGSLLFALSVFLITAASYGPPAFSQSSIDAALLQGTVRDPSAAAVPGATVTITNVATNVAEKRVTDAAGRYLFPDLRAANYNVTVEAQGFKTLVRENVILRVAQQSDLDLTLEVGAVTTTVDVKGAAPLLNTVSAALSQAVENRYITEVPLLDRDIANLAFLAPGVTEVGPSGLFGASPASLTGNNFVSNGQRNATAEVRLDGGLTTSPDEAGGGDIKAYYRPSIEIVQEFTLINNSFSAEYGINGGTVINMVTRSGTNRFHGSGYWFFRRPWMDANDFFANRAGQPIGKFLRDDYGGSVGGPIIKGKTFFFFDYDRVRNAAPATLITTVPTALQKQGNFSQTFNADGSLMQIFNPYDITPIKDASGNITDYQRAPFARNVIPPPMLDPLAMKLMSFYPDPTGPGDPVTGFNNYTKTITNALPSNQFDIKIDHNFSEKSRLMGRYSRHYDSGFGQFGGFIGTPADGRYYASNKYQNAVIEHSWTPSPTMVWTNRIGVDRIYTPRASKPIDPTTVGFPSVLRDAMGMNIFPRVETEIYAPLGTYGWTDTNIRHTYYLLGSALSKVTGPHNLKFGGESRLFYSGYLQPGFPAGFFQFNHLATNGTVFGFNPLQGNGLASLLLGFGDPYSWGGINIQPSVVTHSSEGAVYAQDDWRVTSRLTVNVGLRYEWTVPYTMRHAWNQYGDYNADTGINVPGLGEIHGVNVFFTPDHRRVAGDWNNFGPRVGVAYRLGPKTVLRAGAGVYYSINTTPADWRPGPAYRKYAVWHASLDGGITRFATLENPFPNGLAPPQGNKYGKLNMWGFAADPSLDQNGIRNAEIYQWNAGVQHELGSTVLLEVAYSGSRSTHLDFGGTGNYNNITLATAQKYGPDGLAALVPNPFYQLFQGPNAIFNEPESTYNNSTIPQINLLRPFPQFDGGFSGLLYPAATARYNSLQVRFEKRYSGGLNFVTSYTLSKLTDDNSSGYNNWIGNSSASIQDINNLKAERSIGASSTPHRLVFGGSYELPFGRGKRLGSGVNRWVNGVIGGWQVNGFLTFQSGFPLSLYSFNPLGVGSQRPNFNGNPRSQFSIHDVVDGKGNFFNFNPAALNCGDSGAGAICAPPTEVPGNAPRYDGRLRSDGIHNLDASVFKNFAFRENMKLQFRAEFFNFTNTPRFAPPNPSFGSAAFGTITSQFNSPRLGQIGIRFLF